MSEVAPVKLDIIINNVGNPECHKVLLNDVLLPCNKVEFVNSVDALLPEVKITFVMDGKFNKVNITTDSTEYVPTTIVAKSK